MHRKWLLVFFAIALSACAHRGAPSRGHAAAPAVTVPSAPARVLNPVDPEIVAAIDYWQLLQTLPLADLEKEYTAVQARWAQSRESVRTRLQMIMLLQIPNTRFRNLDRAVRLIDEYVATAPDDSLINFFWWLSHNLYEQRTAEQRLRTIAKRNEVLQQQLEELKSIERTIQERQPAPAHTPG